VASHPRFTFTAKQLIAGIFKILHTIEPKAMQANPNIREDLKKVEESISNEKTMNQINERDLLRYKSIVEEITSNKIDTSKIDTSVFDD
jgi:hypothetical protein